MTEGTTTDYIMSKFFNSGFARLCGCLLLMISAAQADSMQQSGYATAHDGAPIYFEVHGKGEKTILLASVPVRVPEVLNDDPATKTMVEISMAQKNAYIDALGDRYRLILFEYPGELKMYTLTPGNVARDYLAIADAAGVDRFGYVGYSFACVAGIQLALRSDRMTALACGGFPPIDGPYADMLKVTRAWYEDPSATFNGIPGGPPEVTRQFVTYYEALGSFNDRAIQGKLTMPRLSWIGAEDQLILNGTGLTHMGHAVEKSREKLEKAGWNILVLPGMDHLEAGSIETALPIVKNWLEQVWE